MTNPFIGRRESVGLGLEATAGTAVAAQAWYPHLALTLDQKTTLTENVSALGRIEDINDSVVTEEWAEGSLQGKIYGKSFGYLLANMFGSVSATLHSSETTVWDNTFTLQQSTSSVPTLTFTRINPVVTRQYAFGNQSDIEINVTQQDWATFTSTIMSKVGSSTSATAAYTTGEPEFTSKDATLKFASAVAGLSGATAVDFKSIKMKLSRKIERYTPIGSIDPTSFDFDSFGVTGTITARYTDTVNELIALADTPQAMSLSVSNQAITLGTAAHPTLTFTLPKVRLEPQTLDNKLDQVLTQTFNFHAELDLVTGYMIQALLTSTSNGYAHA
jgi:hypothetical protein